MEYRDSLIVQKLDAEVIILDPESSHYYAINSIGAEMMELLQQGATRDEVIAAISKKYQVALQRVGQGYDTFIEQLKEKNMVVF